MGSAAREQSSEFVWIELSGREQSVGEQAQTAHSIRDPLVPAMSGAQAEAIPEPPAGREHVAGRETDALFERLVEERA